jgi:predicted nucleic acid-binding protein
MEVGNVAYRQVIFSDESRERALDALRDCQDFITTACTLFKASDLTEEAFGIAVEYYTPCCDALFLAAAKKSGAPLLTLDRSLYERASAKMDVRMV